MSEQAAVPTITTSATSNIVSWRVIPGIMPRIIRRDDHGVTLIKGMCDPHRYIWRVAMPEPAKPLKQGLPAALP